MSKAADRAAILQQSFRYFAEPRQTVGVQFFPGGIDELAVPGEVMSYTLNVFNRSETLTDTFTLSISGAAWPTSLLTQTVTLGPCTMTQTVLTLNVPTGLPADLVEELTVTAVSPQHTIRQRPTARGAQSSRPHLVCQRQSLL